MRSDVVVTVTEEPDEGNLHVRICGGAGRETGRLYPEADPRDDGFVMSVFFSPQESQGGRDLTMSFHPPFQGYSLVSPSFVQPQSPATLSG